MSDMQQETGTQATGTTGSTGATEAEVRARHAREVPPEPSGWAGWVVFGAMMMILLGSFQVIAGLMALFDEGYYLVGPNGLVVDVDYTTWGWVHLGIGVVALAAGFGLVRGAMWARVLGIVVALVSAVVNFAFLPAYPLWAMMMIAFDVIVIYAIAAHGRELQRDA
jgi:hypothetical protein